MDVQTKQIDAAIRAIRKASLKAFETAANKCLTIFPDAERSAPEAQLVLNLMATQAHESLDLFLRQFSSALNESLDDAWKKAADEELNTIIEKLEAGIPI